MYEYQHPLALIRVTNFQFDSYSKKITKFYLPKIINLILIIICQSITIYLLTYS